jgi:hypothetical protein
MLEEHENHLAKEEKRRDDADEKLQRASRTLVQVKAGVEHLADKLHHLKAVSILHTATNFIITKLDAKQFFVKP